MKPDYPQVVAKVGGRIAFAWFCYRTARNLSWLALLSFLLLGTLLSFPAWQSHLSLHRQLTQVLYFLPMLFVVLAVPMTLLAGNFLVQLKILSRSAWLSMLVVACGLVALGAVAAGLKGALFSSSALAGLAIVLGWPFKAFLRGLHEAMQTNLTISQEQLESP